jgi:hypothetical protein
VEKIAVYRRDEDQGQKIFIAKDEVKGRKGKAKPESITENESI